jgi:hypothetical protein
MHTIGNEKYFILMSTCSPVVFIIRTSTIDGVKSINGEAGREDLEIELYTKR